MPTFAVLLRGVNVGTGNRVPMAVFRELLEARGGSSVRTLQNSGNGVFRAAAATVDDVATDVHEALRERLGLSVEVVVKDADAFGAIVAENPVVPPAEEHARFLVAFAQRAAALGALVELEPLLRPEERLAIGEHAAYLHCPAGIRDSRAAAALLGKGARAVTTRNWATVLKLKALLDASAGPAGDGPGARPSE
jgi:uncharacterized protein (DUF1697 family)